MSRLGKTLIRGVFPLEDPAAAPRPASPLTPAERRAARRASRLNATAHETARNGAHANGSGPGAPPAAAVETTAEPDLLSSLGQLLVANARLDEEIGKLKTGGPKDDEFGRFARQAVHFVDALDRILRLGRTHAESEEVAVWLKSVEAAYERLQRLLEKHDFQILDSVGQEVDLAHHDVMEYRKTTDAPHHTVIDDLQKGIRFRGKMIRDARVVVACNE